MAPPYRLDTSSIDDSLRDIDHAILRQLCEGRCTTGYIAEEIGEQQPYVSRRLGELVDAEAVTNVHRGLYELADECKLEVPADE